MTDLHRLSAPVPPRKPPEALHVPSDPERAATGHTEANPGKHGGPWLCEFRRFEWTRPRDVAACLALCPRCTTQRECANRWLAADHVVRKYGVGVWAGFDMTRASDRATFRLRWGR